MTDLVFLLFRIFLITTMTVGMMASMTEFRVQRGKLLAILAVYCAWVIISSLVLLCLGGELLILRLFFLTISLPAIALTYWAANDSPAQAVFNYITQIMLSVLAASVIRLITDSFGLSTLVNILLMGLFYGAAIFLEWRFLRQPFRMLIKVMPARWGVLTLIPCAFCGYLIFVASWPGSYLDSMPQRVYGYMVVVPLILVYIAVFKSLYGQYKAQMERQNITLLTMQISALKEKLQKVKEVEESIRIQRHDLRHQLQAVTELVRRGDRDTALASLDAAQKRLDEHQDIRWCHPPVLDAVFSSYFHQAEKHGILVQATVSLPDALPVDEGELAIVLANALENAIQANLKLPQEQRKITCTLIGAPSIMLEITNPYAGAVAFDSSGLPIAQSEGHGLGTLSISAFCRKNGAVCQYEAKAGLFSFRMIL